MRGFPFQSHPVRFTWECVHHLKNFAHISEDNSDMNETQEHDYSEEYIVQAHKHSIFHALEIEASSVCCCYYCGFQFDPHDPALEFEFWDTEDLQGREPTITCPMCGIDCVLGDASGYPVTEPAFIQAMTTHAFNGYSRIDKGLRPGEGSMIRIEVE